MATWRCPNCATVQAESSRCFLCRRSATSCGTCAMFRQSLVGGTGYCASDRRRETLSGAEQRECWSSGTEPAGDGLFVAMPTTDTGRAAAERGLIDVTRS
jgi:hypothetical protein